MRGKCGVAALCQSESSGSGDSPVPWMMQGTPSFLMNKKYLVRLTGPDRDELLRYLRFLLFKSYLHLAGQALGWRQRTSRSVFDPSFEQKDAKETKEDRIPFLLWLVDPSLPHHRLAPAPAANSLRSRHESQGQSGEVARLESRSQWWARWKVDADGQGWRFGSTEVSPSAAAASFRASSAEMSLTGTKPASCSLRLVSRAAASWTASYARSACVGQLRRRVQQGGRDLDDDVPAVEMLYKVPGAPYVIPSTITYGVPGTRDPSPPIASQLMRANGMRIGGVGKMDEVSSPRLPFGTAKFSELVWILTD